MSEHKPKSASRGKSHQSIGIGTSESPSVRLKYIPTGFSNTDLYDCVVLLIYCGQHGNVATINTRREHIVWAPFMQLSEGQSWTKATMDSIQRAIGRQDKEMNEADAAKLKPEFSTVYFEVVQIEVPSVNSITRICQLVTLKPGTFKCCVKSRQIEWIPLSKLASSPTNKISHHWGPELRLWCEKLEKMLAQKHLQPNKIMSDHVIAKELKFYASNQEESAEHQVLLGK